jgi:hypothetical protein
LEINYQVTLRKIVGDTIKSSHPKTVRELAQIVSTSSTFAEEDLVYIIKDMVKDGSITIEEPIYEIESSWDYLLTPTLSAWLWAVLGATALALVVIFFIPDIFPLVIIRWLPSSMLVLFLPGYVFLQLLFSRKAEIDTIERFALSVGLSLALVPLIGLLLNYTPFGIRLIPIVASLSIFTLVFAAAAATKGYLKAKQRSRRFYERS